MGELSFALKVTTTQYIQFKTLIQSFKNTIQTNSNINFQSTWYCEMKKNRLEVQSNICIQNIVCIRMPNHKVEIKVDMHQAVDSEGGPYF